MQRNGHEGSASPAVGSRSVGRLPSPNRIFDRRFPMPAYLLTWNPNAWTWKELPNVIAAFKRGEKPVERWSCHNNGKIAVGDSVFLLRQGVLPKGICAHGTVMTASFEAPHWGDPSKTCCYIEFQIDGIADPDSGQMIAREVLDEPRFAGRHWDPQQSGTVIPEGIGSALMEEWRRIQS